MRCGASSPDMMGHTSRPSTGNLPGPLSDESTPASLQNVVYQSATWMNPCVDLPRMFSCIYHSPLANAKALTPPSKNDPLDPLNG